MAELPPLQPSSLVELISALRELVHIAEAEQWDSLQSFDQRIPALLAALEEGGKAAPKKQVEEALALSSKALALCRARSACIEPLISAFDEIAS
jgi:hypothetical protein